MAIHAYLPKLARHFEDRLSALRVDSERRFGTMDSTNMLRHMRKSFESAVGVGAEDVKDISVSIFRTIMFFVSTRIVKKYPGGKISAPGYWSPAAEGDFDEELQLFRESAANFLEKLASAPDERHLHPIFGKLSARQWGLLLGPHLNHHLRQFGVLCVRLLFFRIHVY